MRASSSQPFSCWQPSFSPAFWPLAFCSRAAWLPTSWRLPSSLLLFSWRISSPPVFFEQVLSFSTISSPKLSSSGHFTFLSCWFFTSGWSALGSLFSGGFGGLALLARGLLCGHFQLLPVREKRAIIHCLPVHGSTNFEVFPRPDFQPRRAHFQRHFQQAQIGPEAAISAALSPICLLLATIVLCYELLYTTPNSWAWA